MKCACKYYFVIYISTIFAYLMDLILQKYFIVVVHVHLIRVDTRVLEA